MSDHPPKPVAPPAAAWTPREMLELASRGIGKVVRDDIRGITTLSVDEIAAMAGTLIALGLVATLPGETPPETLLILPQKDT